MVKHVTTPRAEAAAYYILHTTYYILHTIYYKLYTIHYILYTIHYILYMMYYICMPHEHADSEYGHARSSKQEIASQEVDGLNSGWIFLVFTASIEEDKRRQGGGAERKQSVSCLGNWVYAHFPK